MLPDDAADSPAAGVSPLERPETWDLGRFRDALTVSAAPTYPPTDLPAVDGEVAADKSRPR